MKIIKYKNDLNKDILKKEKERLNMKCLKMIEKLNLDLLNFVIKNWKNLIKNMKRI